MKMAFVQLEAMGLASPAVPHHLFAMSQVGMWIAAYGCHVNTAAWNNHHIRSKSTLALDLNYFSVTRP